MLDSQKKEERQNILNGFNFAKKVIDTGECDVLVLDEVLGLVDLEIISIEDIISLITLRDDYCKLVMTGRCLPPELEPYVDILRWSILSTIRSQAVRMRLLCVEQLEKRQR